MLFGVLKFITLGSLGYFTRRARRGALRQARASGRGNLRGATLCRGVGLVDRRGEGHPAAATARRASADSNFELAARREDI